jgi:hypothetical protein
MKLKHIGKIIGFLLAFVLLFLPLTNLFILTHGSSEGNQEQFVAENLYNLDENSLDVLILGSSQVAFGISAVEMYDYAGISAYGIGMSQGSLLGNYYWMLEAFKHQNPSIVMLDVSCLLEVMLESSERISADVMKLSQNKLEMLKAMSQYLEEPFLSYVFPIIKYHSRWAELTQEDFGENMNNNLSYRGLNITDKCKTGLDYDQIVIDNDDPTADVRELYDYQLEYFEKIVAYCQENGKELILFKTPKTSWMGSDSAQVQALADQHGLVYLDFNRQELLEAIGFDVSTDMKDKDHLNTIGAEKLSRYLADYLVENFSMPDRRGDFDFDLQIDRELYEQERTDATLNATSDAVEWLTLLKEHSPCRIFIATKGDIGGKVTPELAEALSALGLETDLNDLQDGDAYVAVLNNSGEVFAELVQSEAASASAQMDNGVTYNLSSENREGETSAKLTLQTGGANRFRNKNGINIVVYNESRKVLLTSVSIDVNDDNEMTAVPYSD